MAKGKCKACDPHDLCEECPEWIFTLADLIMCMMGLFVILWVLKPNGNPKPGADGQLDQKLIETIAAIREAFGYIPDAGKDDPVDTYMILQKLHMLKPHNGPGDGGETKVKRQGAEGTDPEVTTIRTGPQAVVGGRMLFDAGSAGFSPETRRLLTQVADQIRGHRNIVLVKGHASLDDFPENTPADRRMDLSLRRAQAAADLLTSLGVEPEILRVQGCSTFEPVRQRAYTPDGQAMNRRVEVEATSTLADERQDRVKSMLDIVSPTAASSSDAATPANALPAH
ncbi:MAG TPA: OmpA family protein [Tepidisphaeraceae bacterium]|nr:OmpA family protein [Tepidisphaeraceae bacterium]